MENKERKQRTITLTDRAPVRIWDDEWPIIARASGDSYAGEANYGLHEQARRQGDVDSYALRVRQHADGRAIVYAVVDGASARRGSEDWRGGEMIPAGVDIAAAIRRVGEDGTLPQSLIRECIADLPAEEV